MMMIIIIFITVIISLVWIIFIYTRFSIGLQKFHWVLSQVLYCPHLSWLLLKVPKCPLCVLLLPDDDGDDDLCISCVCSPPDEAAADDDGDGISNDRPSR